MTMSPSRQVVGPYGNLVTVANSHDPLPNIGTEINQCKNQMKVIYNFATLGGATGSIGLVDDQGNNAVIPSGCVISRVQAYVATTCASTGSATVALKLLNAADLLSAIAVASLTATSSFTGKPLDGTASATTTYVGPTTAAAGVQISATIATSSLSAGRIIFNVEYYDVN